MNIKKLVYMFPISLLFILGALAFQMHTRVRDLVKADRDRYWSYILADELRQSSADLTRLARTYVVTGDEKYKKEYWEILAWRNGEKPRPQHFELEPGKVIKQTDLMKRYGLTDQEFAKLDEATKLSDDLVTTEETAFQAIEGKHLDGSVYKSEEPASQFAKRIMFDSTYHNNIATIEIPITEFFKMLDKRTLFNVEKNQANAEKTVFFVFVTLALLGVSVVVAFINKQTITKSITLAMGNLLSISNEVADASRQIASSSQTLAKGSSEQVCDLEEASSSLGVMTSKIRQSVERAKKANALASRANQAAQNGSSDMKKMVDAINEIQHSSQETSNIIKVIDEIAFQTNLLALNAAVEAARAGEAGQGFAVVAEEVRNLAMRSAEAAKNTASMIETSVSNANNGVEISEAVATSLSEITDISQEVDQLIGEIAFASREQDDGIRDIEKNMTSVNKVTQENAAHAEESAAASEELSAQTEQLNVLVKDLKSIIS